jgi:glycosyltransferase involved in cell wall biosynthesis
MVAVIVPMLGRAHRVGPLLESLLSTCDPEVLFMLTPGDDDVIAAVEAAGQRWRTVDHRPGDYARKINQGVKETSDRLIFTAADDLAFHPHWLERAVDKLAPGIGVVGTNDLGSPRVMRGEHATHLLVTRAYVETHGTIDEPGKVFHEGYPHEYCDDEAVATAKKRRAWAFAPDSIVEHLHPSWSKAPMDDLYAQQPTRMRAGKQLFQRRRRLWM